MNPLESFFEFYESMDKATMFLFWLVVIFVFVLIVTVITLIVRNRELKKEIKDLKSQSERFVSKDDSKIKEEKIINKENKISFKKDIKKLKKKEDELDTISEVDEDLIETVIEPKENETLKKVPLHEDRKYVIGGAYTKNILKDVGTKNQLSPIALTNKSTKKNNDSIYDKQKLKPISLSEEDMYYDSLNDGTASFIEEVSKKLEADLEPKTVELTDYEKIEEEESVIRYKDLVKRVDKREKTKKERKEIEILDDDDFISELKSFRSNL